MVVFLSINPISPDIEAIEYAVRLMCSGGVIVFPTDTVYGVGCNALDSKAVLRVFEAKKRPLGLPLPLAVNGPMMVESLAEVTVQARKLMRAFWPGALTLILRKREKVPDITTGTRNDVAVRAPNHNIPLLIISKSGLPLVATSANIHGFPSSKNVQEAIQQLGERIDVVLDCGPSLGRPSTVLDLTKIPPKILRQGMVTPEQISKILSLEIS